MYFIFFFVQDFLKKNIKYKLAYDAIQKIHEGNIPRFGGLLSILGLGIIYFLSNPEYTKLIFIILLSSIPLIVISLKEDLFQDTSPAFRISSMIASLIIYFVINKLNFPVIDLFFLEYFLSKSYLIELGFFSFCCLVVINGNNLIDGANGLMPITNLFQFIALFLLSLYLNDPLLQYTSISLILLIIIFLIFNYPFGKIFMGDLGAYFFGFSLSVLTIYAYTNTDLNSLGPVLLLFYQSFELLVSIVRRKIKNKNPLMPDTAHLHSILFEIYKNKNFSNLAANNLVTPSLIIFWTGPFFLYFYFFNNQSYYLFLIFICILTYLVFFLSLIRLRSKVISKNVNKRP